MRTEVKLPQFGMGMTEGTIVNWLKAEGDPVAQGEPICEIEAAKATSEVLAPVGGKMGKIVAELEETVPVYTVIAYIDEV